MSNRRRRGWFLSLACVSVVCLSACSPDSPYAVAKIGADLVVLDLRCPPAGTSRIEIRNWDPDQKETVGSPRVVVAQPASPIPSSGLPLDGEIDGFTVRQAGSLELGPDQWIVIDAEDDVTRPAFALDLPDGEYVDGNGNRGRVETISCS